MASLGGGATLSPASHLFPVRVCDACLGPAATNRQHHQICLAEAVFHSMTIKRVGLVLESLWGCEEVGQR